VTRVKSKSVRSPSRSRRHLSGSMDVLKAIQGYVSKMIDQCSGVKVLLLDSETVRLPRSEAVVVTPMVGPPAHHPSPDARHFARIDNVSLAVPRSLPDRPHRQHLPRTDAASQVPRISPSQRRIHQGSREGTPRTKVWRVLALYVSFENFLASALWLKRQVTQSSAISSRRAQSSVSQKPTSTRSSEKYKYVSFHPSPSLCGPRVLIVPW
jgi:hypothetical protein